jgi:hypothetical protein
MRPASARRSTFIERAAGVLLAAAVLVSPAGQRAGAADVSEADRAHLLGLVRDVDLLEKRNELASGDDFYLLLDTSKSKLMLMLKGAILRDYEFLGLEVGTPRVAFRSRNLVPGWQGVIWSEGNLVPGRPLEREEIVPPDSTALADSTKKFVLPPTPEEKYPVPHRYHVRYAGGLSLEVRPQDLDNSVKRTTRMGSAVKVWYRDLRAAMAKEPEDTLRLRLVLRPEDAASLYRALPPQTRLLVLPPES